MIDKFTKGKDILSEDNFSEYIDLPKLFVNDSYNMVVLKCDCDIVLDSSLVEVMGIVSGVIRTQMNVL